MSFSSIARLLGEKWKGLEPGKKKEFEVMAFIDKQRYEDEMKQWKSANTKSNKIRKKSSQDIKSNTSNSKLKKTSASVNEKVMTRKVQVKRKRLINEI
jgi:hypothetical protein